MGKVTSDSLVDKKGILIDFSKINEKLKETIALKEELTKITNDSASKNRELNTVNKKLAGALSDVEEQEKTLIKTQKVILEQRKAQSAAGRKLLAEQEKLRKIKKQEKDNLLATNSEYKKQSILLNNLRNKYKDLAAEGKANTKEAKALLKEVQGLDKNLKDIDSSVGQNQRSVGNYQKALKGLGGIIKGGLGILGITGLFIGLFNILKKLQPVQDAIAKGLAVIKNVGGTLLGRIKDVATGNIKLRDTFKGLKEEIKDTANTALDIENLRISIRKLNIETTKTVAELNTLSETQAAIADDATKSFQERQAAAEKSEKAAIQAAQQLAIIAAKNYEAIKRENDIKRSQGILNDDLAQQEADLYAAKIEAEKQVQLTTIEANKRRAELIQDNFEQELDFLLDVADAQKTVNERRLQDDRLTFEQRQQIYSETFDLLNRSFDQQLELFQREMGVQLERDKLLQLNNKEIFEYARGLGLSEIATNRLLEVIRERRLAMQDLSDAEKDFNDELAEDMNAYLDELENINDKELQLLYDKINKELEAEKEKAKQILDIENELQNQKGELRTEAEAAVQQFLQDQFESITDKRLAKFIEGQEAEKAALKDKLDQGLITEAEYNKKVEKLENETKKRQARADKANAIFSIGINTATGILKSIAQLGLPAAIPFIATTAAIGAVQAAVVAAKPLPAFKDGGKVKHTGMIQVSEEGSELAFTPQGKMFLTPDKPSIIHAQAGTEIIPHKETQKILAQNQMKESGRQEINHFHNVTDSGYSYIIEKKNRRTKYVNDNYRF